MDFAPLDGITRVGIPAGVVPALRRRGPVFYVPFFSPTHHHIVTPRDLREIDPRGRKATCPLVPQVMSRLAPRLPLGRRRCWRIWATREINLNLGCPSGTVTAKGKGSGFLSRPEELDAFFDQVFSSVRLPVSVKTRLGYQTPEEFPRLLEIFNRYPIACLTDPRPGAAGEVPGSTPPGRL